MLAEEGEFGVSIMIEGDGFPLLLAVTLLAFRPEVGSMNVVLLMAGIATGRCLILVECAFVTPVAFGLPVIALQLKRGITIMLEEQEFPAPFGMTACALLGKSPLMLVVLLMAGVAVGRSLILIQVPLMAGLALGRDMPPTERVFGVQVMIERDGLPIALRMAGFALLSVCPFVFVVFLVTGITIQRRVFKSRS